MVSAKPKLIFIGGAPGVGKSTLAQRLKRSFPGGITLESDEVWGLINNVDWHDKEQHLLALRQTFLLAESFLNSGFQPIVVVDVFTNRTLEKMLELLKDHKALEPYKIISLFLSDEKLKDRVLNRDGGFKDLESCYYCNREIQNQRYDNQDLIDVGGLDKDALANKAVAIIENRSIEEC